MHFLGREPVDNAPEFQSAQLSFTAHIRDPEKHPKPDDVEERRMKIYRELFFNNVKGFIDSGFPVLKKLYPEHAWNKLVRRFFANHRCQTPFFSKISEEFLQFLEHEYEPGLYDPPFLIELAHYEWVELALMTSSEEIDEDSITRNGDLLAQMPALSPLAWLLSYHWPVHHITETQVPDEPLQAPLYLIVYRNRQHNVGFIEANPVTARLFSLIQDNEQQTGEELLDIIVSELNHPDPALVKDGGYKTLLRLHHLDIVAGTQPKP